MKLNLKEIIEGKMRAEFDGQDYIFYIETGKDGSGDLATSGLEAEL